MTDHKPTRVKDLVAAPYNPRQISDQQLDRLGKAMHEFGDLSGIVYNTRTGHLIAGHQRIKKLSPDSMIARLSRASRDETIPEPTVDILPTEVVSEGFAVPMEKKKALMDTGAFIQDKATGDRWTYREVDWDEQKEMAANLAANRQGGEWDELKLGKVLEEIVAFGGDLDLDLTGFDGQEIEKRMLASGGGIKEDDVPEPPENPITRPGDVWCLGDHRVMCGDATKAEDVEKLLDGAHIDAICTDPPYCSGGFQEAGKQGGSVGTVGPQKIIANDQLSTRGYCALLRKAFSNFPAPFLYSFTDWRMWINLFDVVESCGYSIRSMIVWDKGVPGMGRGWRMQHELIMWGCKKTPSFDKHARAQGNVISTKRTGNKEHVTQKPVELMAILLENAPFLQCIADPFLGSGTTLIAAEQLGRRCIGIESSPGYVDVTVQRWQNLTGRKAERKE